MDKEVELREAHRINKEGYRRQDGMTVPGQENGAPQMEQPPPQTAPQPVAGGA
jgi:hypothetical protein